MDERTRPDKETRATEREDAETKAGADRMPTAEEAAIADDLELDPEVGEHERAPPGPIGRAPRHARAPAERRHRSAGLARQGQRPDAADRELGRRPRAGHAQGEAEAAQIASRAVGAV